MAMTSSKDAFSQTEAEECLRLIRKARKHGAFDTIMRRVRDLEDVELDEAWLGSPSGSMTDGSKRLREDSSANQVGMYVKQTTPYCAGQLVPAPPMPSSSEKPTPLPGTEGLPPGVADVTQWGKTLVAFGRYKGIKSYSEMYEATDSEISGYRAYCHSHYQSGSPGLRDLVEYFRARGDGSVASQSVIPGSKITRTYKNI